MNIHWNWVLPIVFVSLFFWSCSQPFDLTTIDDNEEFQAFLSDSLGIDSCIVGDSIGPALLPSPAQTYLNQNYPQDSLLNVVQYNSLMDTVYLTELASGALVLFDGQGDPFLETSSSDPDDFAKAVEQLLLQLYPDLDLDEFEFEEERDGVLIFELEIEDDVEVYLLVNGSEICFEEEDDDGDDGDDDDGDDDDGDDDDGDDDDGDDDDGDDDDGDDDDGDDDDGDDDDGDDDDGDDDDGDDDDGDDDDDDDDND